MTVNISKHVTQHQKQVADLTDISVSEFSRTEYLREFIICFATLFLFRSEVDLVSEFRLSGARLPTLFDSTIPN